MRKAMEPRPSLEMLELGNEGRPAVIIDNFCEDPEHWREMATKAEYRVMGEYYPGRRAPVPPAYLEAVAPLLGAIFRNIFGCNEKMSVQRALYSIVSTPPAGLALVQRIPHVDGVETDRFAMVHYLSHEDWGGTAFYRHRASGFESITAARHTSYIALLMRQFAQTGEPDPAYIEGDTALFERIGLVEHRFNRAILYPSNLLHCSATANYEVFPEDPLTGRLTVAAFMSAR